MIYIIVLHIFPKLSFKNTMLFVKIQCPVPSENMNMNDPHLIQVDPFILMIP